MKQSFVRSWVIHFKVITWWHHPESAFCSRRKCNRFLSIISNEIFYPDLIPECYRIILLLSDVVVRWNTFLVIGIVNREFSLVGHFTVTRISELRVCYLASQVICTCKFVYRLRMFWAPSHPCMNRTLCSKMALYISNNIHVAY